MKYIVLLLAVCLTGFASAQVKRFTFSEIGTRKSAVEWRSEPLGYQRTVKISQDEIQLQVEKNYRLDIVKETHLPQQGVIYLCKDDAKNEVTVVLMGDEKLYLYDDDDRYQITFEPSELRTERSLADAE